MKTNKIIASAASLAVLATIVAPLYNTYAEPQSVVWDNNVSSIKLIRSIPNGYGNITNNFEYTITADPTNPVGVTGAPTALNAAFTGNKSLVTSLDLSQMKFETVGDYSYTITETSTTNSTVYPLDTKTYVATIYVRNNVLHNGQFNGLKASIILRNAQGDKENDGQLVFYANANYTNIGLDVSVDGNSADPNKCFEYTINFEGVTDKYSLDTATTCEGNPTTVGDGDKIYLRHGDTATVGLDGSKSQIPVGTHYTIIRGGEDEYTHYMDGAAKPSSSVSKTADALDSENFNSNNYTSIVEYLNKDIPNTGVTFGISMFVILALAAAGGLYIFSKKKNDQEA